MNSRSDVWIVIPAYNEASVIRSVVESVLPFGYNVVVVNDCSSDDTALALGGVNAHVVSHPLNLGQGAAIQTGISYALSQGAQYLVTFDADGQHVASEIESFLKALQDGGFDIALGTRFAASGSTAENIPPQKKALLKVATLVTRLTTGLKLTDTHNGFRAFTADAARKFKITQNRMAHASQILSQIKQHRMRYTEVPTTIRYTEYSLSKGQKMSNAFNIMWESITEKLRI